MRFIGLPYVGFVNCIHERGPYKDSMIDYEFLRASLEAGQHDLVVAMGKFPSRALDKLGIAHKVIPHPSGLNRQINDGDLLIRVLTELERAL